MARSALWAKASIAPSKRLMREDSSEKALITRTPPTPSIKSWLTAS
jgi:hypothetical protein